MITETEIETYAVPMEYEFHPAADLFPMMTAEELDALGEDMVERPARVHRSVQGHDPRRPQPLSGLHPEGHQPAL